MQLYESAAVGAAMLTIVRRWCGDAAVSATVSVMVTVVSVMVTVRGRAENIRLKTFHNKLNHNTRNGLYQRAGVQRR